MDVVWPILGALLIAVGLRDVFHTLLYPQSSGHISTLLVSALWNLSRATGHRIGSLVGPLSGVAIVLTWALLQAVGWALIYLPTMPEGFIFQSGLAPERYPDPLQALYVSLVTLATLGFGDVVPTTEIVRLLIPLEAIVGFVLLTAAISWFSQIYPPLTRSRSLAVRLDTLNRAGFARAVRGSAAGAASVLHELAAAVAAAAVDLSQNDAVYAFREAKPGQSLPAQVSVAEHFAQTAAHSPDDGVAAAGRTLDAALDVFAARLASRLKLTDVPTSTVLRDFARDHGYNPAVPLGD